LEMDVVNYRVKSNSCCTKEAFFVKSYFHANAHAYD
jgi:hypothetical protein